MPEELAREESVRETVDLRRLFVLRNVAIGGQIATVVTAVGILNMPLPLAPIAGIIAALAVFNAITWFRLRRRWQVTQFGFAGHLLVDVLALTGLLYFSGGATNPFVTLFLLPLTISATVLAGRYTWALSAFTVGCYTLLMRGYVPLPHRDAEMNSFSMHVLGMWLGFVLSAGVIAYFVVGMGNTLRRRERALTAAREQALRDAQLVELGTLAASTAHELGTPLGTMALIAAELDEECDQTDTPTRERLQSLHDQIGRCKSALATLAASAGGVRLSGGGPMTVDRYLAALYSEWHQGRPGLAVKVDWQGDDPAPSILADRTLNQALTNILDNAADASPLAIEWRARWNQAEFVIDIRDDGPGMTAEVKRMAGLLPFTGKPEGLGLGLFLAHAIIGRFGGTVTLFDCKGGGCCTRVLLPCTQLAGAAQ